MISKTEIYQDLVKILVEEFELPEQTISMDMNLYHDLGLDSIDAIDLIVKLQEKVEKKVDPETFKQVRTVEDLVNAIDSIVNI